MSPDKKAQLLLEKKAIAHCFIAESKRAAPLNASIRLRPSPSRGKMIRSNQNFSFGVLLLFVVASTRRSLTSLEKSNTKTSWIPGNTDQPPRGANMRLGERATRSRIVQIDREGIQRDRAARRSRRVDTLLRAERPRASHANAGRSFVGNPKVLQI